MIRRAMLQMANGKVIKSGSFTAASTTTVQVIDTGVSNWDYMLVIPRVYPYETTAARCIGMKLVDVKHGHMLSAFGSSSSASDRVSTGSNKVINEDESINVSNGIVSFGGAQSGVGRFVKNCVYDWFIW